MSGYVSKIDRRTALKWIAAAAATVAMPRIARAATYVKTPGGYGTDPNLLHPTSPWERIMSDQQLQLTATLCDVILPADGSLPSASDVGVPDFINEWISSPYDQTKSDTATIVKGLHWLDGEAKRRFGKGFVASKPSQQLLIVDQMAGSANAAEHEFFKRFRKLTLGGYYTTPEGFKDIGYIGNVPMSSYPGPSQDMKNELDNRLKKIGL